jgi:hypothetical protein
MTRLDKFYYLYLLSSGSFFTLSKDCTMVDGNKVVKWQTQHFESSSDNIAVVRIPIDRYRFSIRVQ